MKSTTHLSIDGLSFHALPQTFGNAEGREDSEPSIAHSGYTTAANRETAMHHQRFVHLEKAFMTLERRLDELYEFLPQAKLRNHFLNSLRISATNHDTLSVTTPRKDGTPTTFVPDPQSSLEAFATCMTDIELNSDALTPYASRLEAIEATCGNLRHSVQDALSMAESTKQLLKAALEHEVAQLHHELGNHHVQLTADFRRFEAAGGEASRRLQEIEQRVEEASQDQLAKTSSLNARMERALRSIDKHSTEVGHLHARLKGELMQELGAQRESMPLEFTSMKQNAEGLSQIEQVTSQIYCAVEESNSRIKELEHKRASDVVSVQLRLQELEQMHVQQRQAGIGSEVWKKATQLEQQLQEILTAHLDMQLKIAKPPSSLIDVQELLMRLAALEAKTLHSDASEIPSSLATSSDVDHLRQSLANTDHAVARLAQSFAGIVENPLFRDVKSATIATPSSETTSPGGGKDPLDMQSQLQRMSTDLSTRLTTSETKFTTDLKHVREIVTSCLALHRATQEDVMDLRPRVASLEVQIVELPLRPSSQVPLEQQQQQQQQRQQMTKSISWGPTQQSDALHDTVSILANRQRLLRGRSHSPANAAITTSQPAVSSVTTVNEAKNRSLSVLTPHSKPVLQAQRLSNSAVVHVPQDFGSMGPHATEGQATSCRATICSARGTPTAPLLSPMPPGSTAFQALNISRGSLRISPGSLPLSSTGSPSNPWPLDAQGRFLRAMSPAPAVIPSVSCNMARVAGGDAP